MSNDRDAIVTGMGFCLPGPDGRTTVTAEDVWQAISTGTSYVPQPDGTHFGHVPLTEQEYARRFPEIPESYLRNYSNAQRYGSVALQQACRDAGLDHAAGDLREAAVIAGRAAVDEWYAVFHAFMSADPATIGVEEARNMYGRLAISGPPTDVSTLQSAWLGAEGVTYTVACGCASSSVALGNAQRLIASGEVDAAVVTGSDYFNFTPERIRHGYAFAEAAKLREIPPSYRSAQSTTILVDALMRPYDAGAAGSNMGNGAVTLILESRERVARRGASGYGQIMAQYGRRVAGNNPLAVDEWGGTIAASIEGCLRGRADIAEIDYINGGAEGNAILTVMEARGVAKAFGDLVTTLPVTSQEACFGHSGSPLGAFGVAATLLMMAHGEICPTTGCETPAEIVTFDPVPGTTTRPARIDRALSLNHQFGGMTSALLIGREPDRAVSGPPEGSAAPTTAA